MDGYPQGGSIFQLVYCISIVRSAGCFFFSLLSIMVLFVSATSWFGCVTSLSLYFFPYLAISSLTVGIFKSLRKSLFLTYHGALTIVLKIFACSVSISFMLLIAAIPHNGTPYVQIGLIIVLYIFSLFIMLNLGFLLVNQYINLIMTYNHLDYIHIRNQAENIYRKYRIFIVNI